jgi:hypothetical protein
MNYVMSEDGSTSRDPVYICIAESLVENAQLHFESMPLQVAAFSIDDTLRRIVRYSIRLHAAIKYQWQRHGLGLGYRSPETEPLAIGMSHHGSTRLK